MNPNQDADIAFEPTRPTLIWFAIMLGLALFFNVRIVRSQESQEQRKAIPSGIRGTVVDSFGNAIPDTFVLLTFDPGSPGLAGVSDRNGKFEILLDPLEVPRSRGTKSFYLWVHAKSYNIKCVRPSMSPIGPNNCVIVLLDEDSIAVSVLDSDGKLSSDAMVSAESVYVPNGIYDSDATTGLVSSLPKQLADRLNVATDKEGNAKLLGVPRVFLSTFRVTKGLNTPQVFKYGNGNGLQLKLQATGTIQGKVTGIDLHAIVGKSVKVESIGPDDSRSRTICSIEPSGQFSADGIPVGVVEIHPTSDPTSALQPSAVPRVHLQANAVAKVTLEYSPGVKFSGRLIAEDTGEPVTKTVVSISSGHFGTRLRYVHHRVFTDENGFYSAYVPKGQVVVQPIDHSRWPKCQLYDYGDGGTFLNVGINDFRVPDIRFSRLLEQVGEIVDSKANPLANRTVATRSNTNGRLLKLGESDEKGNFVVRFSKRTTVSNNEIEHWIVYDENQKVGSIDPRKLPLLKVIQASPLVLMER